MERGTDGTDNGGGTDLGVAITDALTLTRRGLDPHDAARRVLRGLSVSQLRGLAAAAIADRVSVKLRGSARRVEDGSAGWRVEADVAGREIDARLAAQLKGYIQDYTDELRMQWTDELLATSFRLGDGTETTWGDATATQHEQRASLLEAKATSTLNTVARHRAAVGVLASTGAACLKDAVACVAA